MPKSPKSTSNVGDAAQPQYKVEYRETQPFGTLKRLPLALEDNARAQSVATLNQILADTMTLRDLGTPNNPSVMGPEVIHCA